jgi:hypothetical protein
MSNRIVGVTLIGMALVLALLGLTFADGYVGQNGLGYNLQHAHVGYSYIRGDVCIPNTVQPSGALDGNAVTHNLRESSRCLSENRANTVSYGVPLGAFLAICLSVAVVGVGLAAIRPRRVSA